MSSCRKNRSQSAGLGLGAQDAGPLVQAVTPVREEPPACLLGQHRQETAWKAAPPPEVESTPGASVHTRQGSSPVVGRQPPGYCHQAPHARLQSILARLVPLTSVEKRFMGSTDNSSLFFHKRLFRAVFGSQENSAEGTEPSPISGPFPQPLPASSIPDVNMLHLMSLSQHLLTSQPSPHQAQGQCCASWGPGRTEASHSEQARGPRARRGRPLPSAPAPCAVCGTPRRHRRGFGPCRLFGLPSSTVICTEGSSPRLSAVSSLFSWLSDIPLSGQTHWFAYPFTSEGCLGFKFWQLRLSCYKHWCIKFLVDQVLIS